MRFKFCLLVGFKLLLLLLFMAFGKGVAAQVEEATNSTSSPWLRGRRSPRRHGCWYQPWICYERLQPFERRMCCRNRCVDAGADVNNCGLCARSGGGAAMACASTPWQTHCSAAAAPTGASLATVPGTACVTMPRPCRHSHLCRRFVARTHRTTVKHRRP